MVGLRYHSLNNHVETGRIVMRYPEEAQPPNYDTAHPPNRPRLLHNLQLQLSKELQVPPSNTRLNLEIHHIAPLTIFPVLWCMDLDEVPQRRQIELGGTQ
jgi:hypothetical protein